MSTVMKKGEELGKKMVVAGCVPQGERKNKELQQFSVVGEGVTQNIFT